MVRWSKLTDGVWERIAPLLPENGRRGKQWKDHRTIINGILWKLRTEARRHKKGVEHPEDEALGRSRGGLSTKVHLACDGRGARSRWS